MSRCLLLAAALALLSGCVREGDPLAPLRPDAPVLLAAIPAKLLLGSETWVTVTGAGFRPDTAWSVAHAGVELTQVVFLSEAQVRLRLAVSATAATGPLVLRASNPGSVTAAQALLEVAAPLAPVVLAASPATVVQGTSVTVTFTGESFQAGVEVVGKPGSGFAWGAATFLSASSFRAPVDVAPGAAPGPRNVTVRNPDGLEGTGVGVISVTAAAGGGIGPVILSVAPASAPQGTSGLVLDIQGASFAPGAAVSLSGSGVQVASVTFVSPAALQATVDVAAAAPVGPRDLTVTNPDLEQATAPGAFTVTAAPVSFSADVQPIFTANCALAGCHAPPTPQLGQDLSAGAAWASVVNVPSVEVPGKLRVQPGSTAGSYLVEKVESSTPQVGARMPLGKPPLTPAEIDLIKSWVLQGALNN